MSVPSRSRGGRALWALLAAYAATRLARFMALPLFIDEAIHLYWAQRLLEEGRLERILDDGKLLQVLALVPAVALAPCPASAGRLTSILVGAVGLWTTWRLGLLLADRRVATVAGIAYVCCPMLFVYDRMMLADGFLSVFAALSLYFSLRLHAPESRDRGVALGLALAASVLSKIPGLMVWGFPLVVALCDRTRSPRWPALRRAYAVAAAVTALPVIHFFSNSAQIAMKARVPDDGPGRVASIAYNAGLAYDWLSVYWTLPLLACGLVVAAIGWARGDAAARVLAVASAAPVAVFVLVSFHWFPRYVLFATIPFLTLSALGVGRLADWLAARAPRYRRPVLVGLVLIAVTPGASFIAAWWDTPASAPLPEVERFQYVDGWPSGSGWQEVAHFARARRAQSQTPVVLIVDQADHRTAVAVLRAYLLGADGIEVRDLDLALPSHREWATAAARERAVYLVRSGARADKLRALPAEDGLRLHFMRDVLKPDGTLVGDVHWLTPVVSS